MKHFTCAFDVKDIPSLIEKALAFKNNPALHSEKGKGKTLGLVFMNPSLRTRLSTQKAAQLLGMNTLSINAASEGWALEFNDVAMNGTTVEHIREAAAVLGEYCDIIGVRSFPSLNDKLKDDREDLLLQWMRLSGKPILSLESATRHPLQSLADLVTIESLKKTKRPKVVLSWAPHVKPVPQAVANSFAEWMQFSDAEFVVASPEGMELNPEFTHHAAVTNNQQEALDGADFVYVKSWASWKDYGQFYSGGKDWLLNENKLKLTNDAKIMHCLPVRRDVELASSILDSEHSIVIQQAANRVCAAQAVLDQLIETNYPAVSKNVLQKETV